MAREAEERKGREEEARFMAEQQRLRDEAQRIEEEKEAQERAKAEQEENEKLQRQVSDPRHPAAPRVEQRDAAIRIPTDIKHIFIIITKTRP